MQSEPKTFRKRPVVIEAVQWTGKNVLAVYSFMHGAPTIKHDIARDKWDDFESIHRGKDWHIKTLEDGPNAEAKHVASVGDWIIKGVEGEFYPCKPSVFAATYEDAVSVSPSPISADAVVEACAQLVEVRLTTLLTRDSEVGRWLHRLDGDAIREIAAAIRSIKGTFPAMDGWKLVPIEPTQEMLDEACRTAPHVILTYTKPEERDGSVPLIPIATWRAMIAAAPSALVDPEGGI